MTVRLFYLLLLCSQFGFCSREDLTPYIVQRSHNIGVQISTTSGNGLSYRFVNNKHKFQLTSFWNPNTQFLSSGCNYQYQILSFSNKRKMLNLYGAYKYLNRRDIPYYRGSYGLPNDLVYRYEGSAGSLGIGFDFNHPRKAFNLNFYLVLGYYFLHTEKKYTDYFKGKTLDIYEEYFFHVAFGASILFDISTMFKRAFTD